MATMEERFLMRQRGAGARQLEDFDFGLVIPDIRTPSQPGSSGRKRMSSRQSRSATRATGRSVSAGLRSSADAEPAEQPSDDAQATQHDEEGSARKKRRLSSKSPASGQVDNVSINAEPLPDIAEEDSQSDVNAESQKSAEVTPEPGVLAERPPNFLETPQSPTGRRKIRQYSGSAKRSATKAAQVMSPTPRRSIGQSRLSGSPANPYKKRKKRKSVGQKAKGHSLRHSLLGRRPSTSNAISSSPRVEEQDSEQAAEDDELPEASTSAPKVVPTTKSAPKPPVRRRLLNALKRITSRGSSKTPQPDEPVSSGKKRGRPRKSAVASDALDDNTVQQVSSAGAAQITPGPKKRGRPRQNAIASSALDNSTVQQASAVGVAQVTPGPKKRGRPRKSSPVVIQVQEVEEDENDEIAEEPTSASRRRSPSRGEIDDLQADQGDEEEQPDGVEEETLPIPKKRGRPRKSDVSSKATPAAKRQKKTPNRISTSSALEPPSSTGKDPAMDDAVEGDQSKTISVGVYRMRGAEHLTFDLDSEDEDDAQGSKIPNKRGPNAVDVLNQICSEVIEKNLRRLRADAKRETDRAKKRELQEAQRAVAQFGNELDARLMQMTTALDHNHALATQLRAATKRHAAARAELLDLRKQLEDVAVQSGAVRAEHEAETREACEEIELDGMLADLEAAVKRGRDAERKTKDEAQLAPVGLELRLKEVVDGVSAADGRLGMLGRVKGLNEVLERAVAAA